MTTAKPLVSVVLPTYNRAHHLQRSVGSVLHQSFRDFELIIVDDGSTDDTRDVVAGFRDPRVRYVARERNGGVAAARNTGVRAASGTYLAFQDSDDEWLLDKLTLQLRALQEAGPDYGMCVCGLLRYGGAWIRRYPLRGPEVSRADILSEPIAYTQTWLVRRDALAAASDGFDETLRIWDDWELLMRLSARLRIRALPDMLVVSERGPNSLSADGTRFIHDLDLILRKHSALFATYPKQHARLQYQHGRRLAVAGQVTEARAALWRAVRLRPRTLRPGIFWLATLFGSRLLRSVLRAAPRN